MKIHLSICMFLLIIFPSHVLMAETDWIRIDGSIDPSLTKVKFLNSDQVTPIVFENGHHAINRCYKISNGFLIFVDSREGIFEGYELNKYNPPELKDKKVPSVKEIVQNKAGIYLGVSRQQVEKIFNRKLNDLVTNISYESVKIINEIPFDVITSVVIAFDKDKLVKLSVITTTTN